MKRRAVFLATGFIDSGDVRRRFGRKRGDGVLYYVANDELVNSLNPNAVLLSEWPQTPRVPCPRCNGAGFVPCPCAARQSADGYAMGCRHGDPDCPLCDGAGDVPAVLLED